MTGGSDEQGLGLFRIPIDGGTPVRLAKGLAINPVWSPDGSLIVYAATSVSGRQPLAAVRPDGTPVELPQIHDAPGNQGHRFLPKGKGIVFRQINAPRGAATGESIDFWLEDLDGKTKLTSRSVFPSEESLQGALATGMTGGAIESWDRLEEEIARM